MIRLAVRAPRDAAEQVLASLLELAPGGVEQVDGHGFVEYAIYGTPGELPALGEGPAQVGGVQVHVSGREVPEDWGERWKRFHVPVLVGGKLYVRPPWEDAPVRPGVIDVVIDPGQAFGTGSHPTTRMCLELLLELDERGSLVDIGCGSGVVAIAAAKLGFRPVRALDFDVAAVRATRDNALANHAALASIEHWDLRTQTPPAAEVVTANLTSPLLRELARRLTAMPRALIVSGLLVEDVDEVVATFHPLAAERVREDRGWAAAVLREADAA